jgi:serine/threonine protein kinase
MGLSTGTTAFSFGRRVASKVVLVAVPLIAKCAVVSKHEQMPLRHPHILPLIGFGDERFLYLVMPFIRGGTLTGYLRRFLPDLSDVAAIFLRLLDAIGSARERSIIVISNPRI